MSTRKFASTYRAINKLYRQGFAQRPDLDDLTILEAMTLCFVAEESGRTTNDIARKVGVRRDTVEKLVAKLSDLKLVELAPFESDGGETAPALQTVSITPQGEMQRTRIEAVWDQWEKDGSRQLKVLDRVAQSARQLSNQLTSSKQ